MPKKLLIILLIVVIGGGIVVGGTFAWRYWQTLKQEGEPAEEEESEIEVPVDWKTYRNEKYGFSIKYSRDWELSEKPLPVYPDDFTIALTFTSSSGQDKIFFDVRPKGDEGMIREAYSIISEEKININGVTSSRITGAGQKEGFPRETFILVTKGPYLYQLKGEGEIFDQMLSTFRFIEVDETANWKTYRNEEMGFEIKYPKEWEVKATEASILFTDVTKTDILYPEGLVVFTINILDTPFDSIHRYFEEKFQDRPKESVPEYTELTVNNTPALRFFDPISIGGCPETIIFLQNSKLYELNRTGPTCEYSDKLFNQILYTFKFIETDETANWKTYRSEEMGIEFKYPSILGVPEVSRVDNTQKEPKEVFNGKKIVVYFKENGYSWVNFRAHTPDYRGFKEFPFGGSGNIVSECPNPLTYGEKGEVCKIVEVAGEKAIWENFFREDECASFFGSQIYFNNKSPSIYKGLMLVFHLKDAEAEIDRLYSCIDNESLKKAYSEAVTQSKNIMERKNLSESDLEKLNLIDQILSTFKFIEQSYEK